MSALGQYAPQAAKLFGTMIPPTAALVVVAAAFLLVPLPSGGPKEEESMIATSLRRLYPLAAFLTLSTELISLVWATIAVVQITQNESPTTNSVAHLMKTSYALPWAAVNAHFIVGLVGFMMIIAIRLFFMCGRGFGIAMSVLMFLLSIINRAIASGKKQYGDNIMVVFETYAKLFTKRAITSETFGYLEVYSVGLMIISVLVYLNAPPENDQKSKKVE